MRDRAVVVESNFDEVLLCILDALADCLRNLSSLAEANAYLAFLVADDNKGTERETAAALADFCYSIDLYNFLLELRSLVVHISSHSFTSFGRFLRISAQLHGLLQPELPHGRDTGSRHGRIQPS